MRRLIYLAAAALWCAVAVPAAFAYSEWVEEVWRSPAGTSLLSRAVNARDGSVWAQDRRGLVRLSPAGEELERRTLDPPFLLSPHSLAISPYDGSWWISRGIDLTHFSADGAFLAHNAMAPVNPLVDPTDGSLWGYQFSGVVSHLGNDGELLWTLEYPCRVAGLVLVGHGLAWVATDRLEGGQLECLSATGESIGTPVPAQLIAGLGGDMERSPTDGSFYAYARDRDLVSEGGYDGWVGRMASDGALLWKREGFREPLGIAPNPVDGSVWVVDRGEIVDDAATSVVTHLSADGTPLWHTGRFAAPFGIILDPRDGSVWFSDLATTQVVHLRVVASPFPDLPADSWAFSAIAACVDTGIVQGYWNGYRPDQVVTRDQMAVYIARAVAGSDQAVQVPSWVTEPIFSDVDEDHWAYRYITYCVAQNIVEGHWDGTYRPEQPVDRGQMAVYIARALVTPSGDAALPDPPAAPTFPDVTADNDWAWCYPQVEYCAAEGIVRGYWDGYRPGAPVTRDQMAVYIARAFALPL